MKIQDLKTGLYFTLSKENLEKTAEYGNSYNTRFHSDQRYTYYTAVKHKDAWYMLNTYQLSSFYVRDMQSIDEYLEKIEQNQSRFYDSTYNYCYSCRIKLTQKLLNLFDFSFDLRNYKILSKDEAKEYRRKDLLEVQLYWEHRYPNGIIITKKENTQDSRQQQLKFLDDLASSIKAPCFNQYAYDKYIQKMEDLYNANEEVLEEVKIWANKIKEMSEEISNLQDSFTCINPHYGTLKIEKLDDFLDE